MPKKTTSNKNKKTVHASYSTDPNKKISKTPNKYSSSTIQQISSPKNKQAIIILQSHHLTTNKHKNSPQHSHKSKNYFTSKRSQKSQKIPLEMVDIIRSGKNKSKNKVWQSQEDRNDGTFYREKNKNINYGDFEESDLQNTIKSTSKNSKLKTKIDLSNKKLKQLQDCPSYRQYCVIDKSIVPVVNSHEKRFISGLMGNTQSTCDNQNQVKQAAQQQRLKYIQRLQQLQRIKRLQKSVNTKILEVCQAAINACQQHQDFGTQYSARITSQQSREDPDFFRIFKVPKVSEAQINNSPIKEMQNSQKTPPEFKKATNSTEIQTLDQLLLKLQFLHLPNDNSFKNLTDMQRDHYMQLLKALISKMNMNPQKANKKKVNLYSVSSSVANRQQEVELECQQQQKRKLYESLKIDIYLRQCRMVNALQQPQHSYYSLLGIIEFLTAFLGFVELNYSHDFLFNLRCIYGYNYKRRFIKIRLNRHNKKQYPIQSEIVRIQYNPAQCFQPILSQKVFNQFLEENFQNSQDRLETKQQEIQIEQSRKIFYRCLLDVLNSVLDQYRGHYPNGGQPFPWSCKIVKSNTFFTIDQESLDILFSQVKEHFIEISSFLSGLLVDSVQYEPTSKQNPVVIHHKSKETRLVQQYLTNYDDTYEIQNCLTGTLLTISDLLWEQIIEEIVSQVHELVL